MSFKNPSFLKFSLAHLFQFGMRLKEFEKDTFLYPDIIQKLIFLSLIHSFIISLLFSPRTPSSNFEGVPLTLTLLSFSFQKSNSLFSNFTTTSSLLSQ